MTMKNSFIYAIIITLLLTLFLSACTDHNSAQTGGVLNDSSTASSGNTGSGSDIVQTSTKVRTDISVEYDTDDENSSWSVTEATGITLEGNSISISGEGATAAGSNVTITSAGTYIISGTLSDGQIIVNTTDKGAVRLVLNGAEINCSTSAPIYIKDSGRTVIILAEGTQNKIADGTSYVLEDTEAGEPNAAIFSKSDLTFNGNGSLMVKSNYNDAIASKDELKIISGNITINAVGDGIRGRDYVAVKNGTITINSKGEGIKSNNDEDATKGFILIENGTINITSEEDAIQAETSVLVNGGSINITSGGGNSKGVSSLKQDFGMKKQTQSKSSNDSVSAKGIKATVDITINGGSINIDSADDSIHSNNSLTINGGNITTTSGDDGIHSDAELTINSGDINITKSYEGIESAVITINDGNINVISSDDAINVAGGNDSSSMNGRPGQNNFNTSNNNFLNINGGYVSADATGDGIDVNGSIKFSDGIVIVNGPTSDGNAALDYDGSFSISGGILVAAGSSGMAQAPDTSSTQNSAIIGFSSTMPVGTMVHIESEDGEEILTYVPTKNYQSVVVSSPKLKDDSSYNIYYGGSSTGTAKDGLYTGGTYTGGTKYDSFKISNIVTTVGEVNTRGPGGMGGGKREGFRK
jgi:hypothetical protein